MHPTNFFVPSFLKAISENKEEGFRKIITEPSPGILTFELLQPRFCEMLLAEVATSLRSSCTLLQFSCSFSFYVFLSGSDCLGR